MKALVFGLIVLSCMSYISCYDFKEEQEDLVKKFRHCYENYTGINMLPRTTDHLIDLIQRVERYLKHKEYKLSELATVLLLRFRRDKINYKHTSFGQDDRFQVPLFTMFPKTIKNQDFIEKTIERALKPQELCDMHFMLSSSKFGDKTVSKSTSKTPGIFKRALDMVEDMILSSPPGHYDHYEEFGTLYHPFGTIFGGSLLAGIASSSHARNPGISQQINEVYGSTLAYELALAVFQLDYDEGGSNVEKLFQLNGKWKDQFAECKRHYNNDELYGTSARLLGAIDGLVVGMRAVDYENQGYTLSTLLGMYYGFSGKYSSFQLACRRFKEFSTDKQLLEQTKLVALHMKLKSFDTSKIDESVDIVYNYFKNTVVDELKKKVKVLGECPKKPTKDNPASMNDPEVIVVMDSSGDLNNNYLASSILNNIRSNGSNIGVYTNFVDNDDNLDKIVGLGSGLTKTEAICGAENFIPKKSISYSLNGVIKALSNLYGQFNEKKSEQSYIPPQVAVVMTHGAIIDVSKADKALANFKDYMPGVALLIMGNVDGMKELDEENRFPLNNISVDSINKRISEIPGQLVYQYCVSKKSNKEKNFIYNSQVLPNAKKTIFVHPKYFKGSEKVKITVSLVTEFLPGTTTAHVSIDRGYSVSPSIEKISLDKRSSEHTFEIKNPCGDRDEGKCRPIALEVVGGECKSKNNHCCKDLNTCIFPNQIPYRVTHEGFYCGGSARIVSSILLLVIAVFFSTMN